MLSSSVAGQLQMAIMRRISQIAGLVVGLMAMASISGEAAAMAWERWRQGLRCVAERIQSKGDLALTCKVLSTLLVGLENRQPSVLGRVTSALWEICRVVEVGGRQICLQYSYARTIRPCVSADMDWTLPPRAPTGLEDEARILYKWAMDRGATSGNVIALLGCSLFSGCVHCRVLLALIERRESQTPFGTDFYSEDTSSASWAGKSGWLKGTLRDSATLSIGCLGPNFTQKPIQTQMGRLLEQARAVARHRRAQFGTNVDPLGPEKMVQVLPEDTSPIAAPTMHGRMPTHRKPGNLACMVYQG